MIPTYENWLQTAPWLNCEEAWPARLFPDAEYRYFRDCGCLVCALTVMLRHGDIEKEEDKSLFNPWILNERLIDCGAFTSDADLELAYINRLYPIKHLGEFSYSREELVHLMEWDFPCLVTVPGSNAERHFIVPLFTVTEDVIVFDPLCGEKRLSTYNRICGIRRFADRIVMRPQG